MFLCVNNATSSNKQIKQLCDSDIIDFIVQFVFLICFLFLSIIFFWKKKKISYRPWRSFSHSGRYILSLLLIFTLICLTTEGLIAENGFPGLQLHMYLSPIFGIFSMTMSLVIFNFIETTHDKIYMLILLLFWFASLITNTMQIQKIFFYNVGFKYARFSLTCLTAFFRLLLCLLEIIILFHERYILCQCKRYHVKKLKTYGFVHPYCNFLSKITWHWLSNLLTIGFKKTLELSHLGTLPLTETCKYNSKRFSELYLKNRNQSIWKVIFKTHWCCIIAGGIFKLFSDCLLFFGPIALNIVVRHIETYKENEKFLGNFSQQVQSISYTDLYADRNISLQRFIDEYKIPDKAFYLKWSDLLKNGYFIAVVALGVQLLQNIFWQNHFFMNIREGIRCKGALQASIFQKSLRLNSYSISDEEFNGRVLNHMSLDVFHIYNLFYYGHCAWTIPIQVVVTVILLYHHLGVSSIIGAIILFITLPLQVQIGNIMSKYQKKAVAFTDKRIKQCSELLQSMKLLKLYSWEVVFREKLAETRYAELRMLLKAAFSKAGSIIITEASPSLAIMATFLLYNKIEGKQLTASNVFSGVALFNLLLLPFLIITIVVGVISHARISGSRLQDFFQLKTIKSENRKETFDEKLAKENNFAIEIKNGSFVWDESEPNKLILTDINLSIPLNKLSLIIGRVGSGKSSLISAIIGEMTTISGFVKVKKFLKVAYASQRPWLMNATLKQNILFGSKMDESRYKKVIECSALQQDLDILEAGDETEIGERGINLSGGQKQRISIARCLYSDADIIIFDDPMSALDVHVGIHIFEQAIQKYLIKQLRKTVILSTNQVQYANKADLIIVMENGHILVNGNYNKLVMEKPKLVQEWKSSNERRNNEEVSITSPVVKIFEDEYHDLDASSLKSFKSFSHIGGSFNNLSHSAVSINVDFFDRSNVNTRRASYDSSVDIERKRKSYGDRKSLSKSLYEQSDQLIMDEDGYGQIISEEERQKGAVSLNVYKNYVMSIGLFLALFTILIYAIRQSIKIYSDYWLAHWTDGSHLNLKNMMLVYGLLCLSYVIFSVVCSFMLEYSCIKAAKRLYSNMLHTIVDAPMRFFDTTPLGRIINRFTTDTMIMDEKISVVLDTLFYCSLFSLGGLIVNALASWYFILSVIPLVAVYFLIQRYYIATSRDLQRLDSINKSPILNHFTETLSGLTTIRAFKDQNRYSEKNCSLIDKSNMAFLFLQTTSTWVGIRLDMIGSIVVFIATLTSLTAGLNSSITAGVVGLCIAYSLTISANLNWVMKSLSESEMFFNSVERIIHYTENVDSEVLDGEAVEDNWPVDGRIEFNDLSLTYGNGLPNIIQDLSLNVGVCEKIGVCGRTGSGKSSLMLGLFRLINISNGSIRIDDVDITKIPIRVLRSRMAIIPQDPLMFSGTIRFNLDPLNEYTDSKLWKILEIAQLSKTIKEKSDDGLDTMVTEGGENFSLGQRQLFCLARALLRNSRILIMDEATASVDLQTDQIIQAVVREFFKDTTILTIAHRVATIMKYDRVVVLKNGNVLEVGNPMELKLVNNGAFATMVKDNL